MGMTDRRLELHERLCDILGSRNVYYMPGSDVTMHYPCIRYSMANIDQRYANNRNYMNKTQYTITLITDDPDTDLRDRLQEFFKEFPYSENPTYTVDNLCHDVFNVYY